jgi:PPOX class probable F420-dependent enzyme
VRLSADEARRRFAAERAVRLASVSGDGLPHLVPVTFAVDRDVIYTAIDAKPKSTRQLRRLSNIRANPAVCVLADHYADDWSRLWWARADGIAAILGDPEQIAAPLALLAARYPQYQAGPPPGPVIAVQVSRWQGWSAS